jgi:hypothetical protein
MTVFTECWKGLRVIGVARGFEKVVGDDDRERGWREEILGGGEMGGEWRE